MKNQWLFFLILTFCLHNIQAQNLNVSGVFPTIDHSGTFYNKFDYSLYYFAAFPLVDFQVKDLSKDAYFHLFYSEQALTFKSSDKLSFTGSYVYQRENVLRTNYINENRFYLQAKYKHAFSKIKLTNRLRFDGRFVQNNITKKAHFTHRIRYLLGVEIPINEKSYFTTYEEVFFNTFKNASPSYTENWLYSAFGRILNEQNKIEAGLLYLTWNIGNNAWFNQYYLQLTWINHINFTKNK